MKNDAHPQILSSEDSAFWRQAYLEAFVNTSGEYYRNHIVKLRQFSDGVHHDGYLWDCLRFPLRITIERFKHQLVLYPEVMVMADNHSHDRIPGAALWPYPSYSVARFTPHSLLASLDKLPEDIYVFDSTVSWTLVLTHEHDHKRRICCAVGIKN